jgi:hypothetical protein
LGTRVWTQGLTLAWQVLNHLSVDPSPFSFRLFFRYSLPLLPGASLRLWSSYLLLLSNLSLLVCTTMPRLLLEIGSCFFLARADLEPQSSNLHLTSS